MADIDVLEGDGAIIVVATVAGQNVFDFDFLAYTGDTVQVTFKPNTVDAAELTFGVDYTVAGLAQEAGGSITLAGAYAGVTEVDDELLIYRSTPIRRLFDYQNAGDFRAETVNREFDLMIMIDQENRRDVDRSLKAPLGGGATPEIIVGADDFVPVWIGGNLGVGPSVAQIAAAEGYAEDADEDRIAAEAAAAAAAQALADLMALSGVFVVTSIAALKAINTAGNIRRVLLDLNKQSGLFLWRAGDYSGLVAADPQNGRYVKADAVLATAGAWERVAFGEPTLEWFGADSVSGNNQVAAQAALDYAKAVSKRMRIPAGSFAYAQTMISRGRMLLEGDGMDASVLYATGTYANAAFMVDMAAGDYGHVTGHSYRDFQVAIATPAGRTAGMHIKLALGVFLSNFELDRVKVTETQNWGLFLDNTAANYDGFFVATIRRCVFFNGLYAPNLGDSINIDTNQITGGDGGLNPAVYLEGVDGARQYIVRENNLTCRGGAVVLIGTDQARLENNQCEHGWWYGNGDYTGAFNAHVYVSGCLQPIIRGNTMNPFPSFNKPVVTVSGFYHNGTPTIDGIASTFLINVGDKVTSPDGLLGGITRTVLSKTANSITLDGNATSTAIADVVVTRLVNSTAPASASVVIDGACNEALIEDNDMAIGGVAHIIIGAAARNTRVGRNRYYGSLTPTIIDGGIGTMGVTKPVSGFLNGWAGATAAFRKGLDLEVSLSGILTGGGTMAANAFVLPVGFRPAATRLFSVPALAGAVIVAVRVTVYADGNVRVDAMGGATGVTEITLDPVSFIAPLVS